MFVIERCSVKESPSRAWNISGVSVVIYVPFLEDAERMSCATVCLRRVLRREINESSPDPVVSIIVGRCDRLPRFRRDTIPADTGNKDFPDFFGNLFGLIDHHHRIFFISELNGIIKVAKNKLTTIEESSMMRPFPVIPLQRLCEPSCFCEGFCHDEQRLFHRIHHLLVRLSAQENFGVGVLYPVCDGGGADPARLSRRESP